MPANDVVSRIKYSQDPWDTIAETPWGDVPMWKYATLTCGNVGAYSEYLRTIRSDAADATSAIADAHARADALDEREADLNRREGELNAKITLFNDAVSRFAEMVERKADTEPLPLPPTEEPEQLPEDPPSSEEPDPALAATKSALFEDEEMQQPEPGGELHVLHAKDPELVEPPQDAEGDLPRDLRMPEYGNYPTLEQEPRKQIAQPVSISLNKEDN